MCCCGMFHQIRRERRPLLPAFCTLVCNGFDWEGKVGRLFFPHGASIVKKSGCSLGSLLVSVLAACWHILGDVSRLHNSSLTMGKTQNYLNWGKDLWTHLWMDHMH